MSPDSLFLSVINFLKSGLNEERRNLQRLYVEKLCDLLTAKKVDGDLRAAARYHLAQIAGKLRNYMPKDGKSRAHGMDLRERILAALKPGK